MTITVLLALFFCCHLISGHIQQVCIIPESGNQDPPSYCESTYSSIDHYCLSGQQSNVVIDVLNGNHILNVSCMITGAYNISLRGDNEKTTVQCSCSLDQSFLFVNVTGLCISGIKFVGCGNGALLWFINGSDITLTDVTLSGANNIGVYIGNVAGLIIIKFSQFMMVSANYITRPVRLAILNTTFRKCGVNDTLCILLQVESSQAIVNFTNVDFTDNRNADIMEITLNELAFIRILNCSFDGSFSTRSRGLMLYFFHQAFVSISDSTFSNYYSDYGSGIYVEIEYAIIQRNSTALIISNSNFTSNKAFSGGAGIQFAYSYTTSGDGFVSFYVINSRFSGNSVENTDLGGKAISCLPYGPLCTEDCTKIHLYLINSSFFDNYGTMEDVINVVGIQLHVNSSSVQFNTGTAIAAGESSIIFSGNTRIANNFACTGAGLVLANSHLKLVSHASLMITNNTTQRVGGGVLIQGYSQCHTGTKLCFLEIENTARFTIVNNHALGLSGDNIFGSYGICPYLNESLIHVPRNNENQPSSVSSYANKVCTYSSDQKKWCILHSTRHILPGQNFTIPLHVLGLWNGTTAGTVTAKIKGGTIPEDQISKKVDSSGTINATYTVYSSAYNTSRAGLILQACDGDFDQKLAIDIIFRECTFGFNSTHIENGFRCQCIPNPAISTCSLASQVITKKKNYWLGMFPYENVTYLATSEFCPLDYCYKSFLHIKSLPTNLAQDEQCQYNRTGILCGSCSTEFSLVLGASSLCHKCSNVWLLLILPFALAGLLLVVFIHFLNLTVTMGTVCGLIFYANVIQDYSVIMLSTNRVPGLTSFLQVFLSWINLDLGITSCFYNGMEAFGKALLLFVFPIYVWLISTTIVILSHRYIFFTKLVGENAVKILSTLFLLSYSKMIRATVYIFNFKVVNIFTTNGTVQRVRWAADGNISYLDSQTSCCFSDCRALNYNTTSLYFISAMHSPCLPTL